VASKYLGINLTKDMKAVYNENYKTLKKEIEKDIRRWKDLPYSRISRITIMYIAILPRAICMLNAIPIKILITSMN
jgi:hypothetical protein